MTAKLLPREKIEEIVSKLKDDCGKGVKCDNHGETFALLDHIEALETDLYETWLEPKEHGPSAWRRPTAEAYARVCVLYRKEQEKIKALEAKLASTQEGAREWKRLFDESRATLIPARDAAESRVKALEALIVSRNREIELFAKDANEAESKLSVAEEALEALWNATKHMFSANGWVHDTVINALSVLRGKAGEAK